MSSPDQVVDNSARNAAIKLVKDAVKSGRIIQADHDMRVDQLERAQTMQEIDLVVRDLRASGAGAPPIIAPVAATQAGQPWPLVNYGPQAADVTDIATAVGKTGGRAIGGIIAVIVLVSVVVPIVGAIIAFVSARDSFPDFGDIGPTDDTTYLPGQAPGEGGINVHTVDGFNELVDALRDETDQTYAFSAVIYPRYAVLEVPTGTGDRYEDFYWDGELSPNGIKGTTTNEEFDLSLVDPEQMIDMLTEVRGRLDNPKSWYVIVGDYVGTETQITAYASNDFNETTYIVANLDGTVVYDSETVQQ